MAKVKLGAIVVDMSGKLGGHVFAKNRGGNYMRTKTTPTNPQTSYQTSVRALFATISSSWSGLTVAKRNSWNDKVGSYAKTNVFGDLKNPTGKALFQRLNQNLGISGQSTITDVPDPKDIPSVGTVTAILEEGVALNVASTSVTTGSKILYYATPPLSNGTSFVKNKLRLLTYATGGLNVTTDIRGAYASRYAEPLESLTSRVWVGVRVVNANGQASPMQIVEVLPI